MNQDHCLVEQFEMIFRAHFSSVKFFINMFLKSEADAEDLAQDVFTKLWTNFETWQNNDGKEGYIYAMAKNVAFDFIKHKRLENDYRVTSAVLETLTCCIYRPYFNSHSLSTSSGI